MHFIPFFSVVLLILSFSTSSWAMGAKNLPISGGGIVRAIIPPRALHQHLTFGGNPLAETESEPGSQSITDCSVRVELEEVSSRELDCVPDAQDTNRSSEDEEWSDDDSGNEYFDASENWECSKVFESYIPLLEELRRRWDKEQKTAFDFQYIEKEQAFVDEVTSDLMERQMITLTMGYQPSIRDYEVVQSRLSWVSEIFEGLFGGIVFIAPFLTEENSGIVSETPRSGRELMFYAWSDRMRFNVPELNRNLFPQAGFPDVFRKVQAISRPLSITGDNLLVPESLINLERSLIVPVVSAKKVRAFVVLANLKPDDEEFVSKLVSKMMNQVWDSLMSSSTRQMSRELLSRILPSHVIHDLLAPSRQSNRRGLSHASAKYYEKVSVMFMDIVGFSSLSGELSSEELVFLLDQLFRIIDGVVYEYRIEKIKTIGDAYMAASGLSSEKNKEASNLVKAALAILDRIEKANRDNCFRIESPIRVRIGIHTGPVVGGIIGALRPAFDIWGKTVNIASRAESTGVAGKLQITDATLRFVAQESDLSFTPRGSVYFSGCGKYETYFVKKVRSHRSKTAWVLDSS